LRVRAPPGSPIANLKYPFWTARRGIWFQGSPGAFYQGEARSEEAWQEIEHFWDDWGEEEPE
jgi:hypothetical protein